MTNSPPRSITSSMMRGKAYESMMWPRSSTISENVIVSQVVYPVMDAVILDVGGVLLVPHEEPVNLALSVFGIELDGEEAERAHYFVVHAMDLAEDDESAARLAYLVRYADADGVAAS